MRKKLLTLEEREQIEKHLKANLSVRDIARLLGRAAPTIYSEIYRAGGRKTYTAQKAHQQYLEVLNRNPGCISRKMTEEEVESIKKFVKMGLSRRKIATSTRMGTQRLRRFMNENFPGYRANPRLQEPGLINKISSIEMQIEILTDQIKILNERIK